MDFQISTSALASVLSQTADVAADKGSSMPILGCVLLTAETTPAGGSLSVRAYDLELGVSINQPCEIKKDGTVALPAKKLLEVVKTLPTPVTRIKLMANNRVEITSGSASFRLAGQHADDFPTMPKEEGAQYLPTKGLDVALDKVAFAMSHDETRYNLNGVYLDLPKAKVVATDGHRLAMSDAVVDSEAAPVIISKKTVAKLRKLIGSEGENRGEFAINGSSLMYRRMGLTLVARLIDGSFPDYTQVVPERGSNPVRVDRVALRDALNRVMLLTADKASPVSLAFEGETITVATRNPDTGDATDNVMTKAPVESFKVNLNGHYLLDMLNVASSEVVEIHHGDEMSPVVVAPDGDLTHTYVLMPMRG